MLIMAKRFLALILTALALVPGGAHLLALPNKIAMDHDQYLATQQVYRGWALVGVVLIAALLANLALAFALRGRGRGAALATAACALIAVSFAVFFVWTWPANQATENWTRLPADWEELRRQWEYSHAVNALLIFAALCCSAGAALSRPPASAP